MLLLYTCQFIEQLATWLIGDPSASQDPANLNDSPQHTLAGSVVHLCQPRQLEQWLASGGEQQELHQLDASLTVVALCLIN